MAEIEKHRESAWFSVLANVLLLLFLLLIFRPAYETNDDMGMANIVNGAKGVFDPHLVFSNYLLGVFLSCLYRLCEGIPWYPLLQYAVLFCSFTAVTYVMNRRRKRTADLWVGLVLLVVFAYEGYINLQFTKTAGIASAAGILLLFYAVAGEGISKGAFAAGFLLGCVGSMYRMHQFLAEGFLMTGIGVYQVLKLKDVQAGRRLKRLSVYVGTFGLLLVAAIGLRQYDRHIYSSSEEWQEYLEYNMLRGRLYDYGFPDYDENKETYRALGIKKTAYKMLQTWNHMDTELITAEVLEELYALQPQKKLDAAFIQEFFGKFPVSFSGIPVFYCFLLILLYWIFWGRHRWTEVASVIYEMAAVFCMYLYLYFQGRYLLNRVDVGIWFAASLAVFWIYQENRHRFSSRAGFVLFFGVLVLYQKNWQERYRSNTVDEIAVMDDARAVIETIQTDKEHLYLTKTKTVSFTKSYGVFDTIPLNIADNLYSLGGWASGTPVYSSVLEKYGVTNPFRDLIGNEKVYLIDNHIDLTMKYIHRYYDEDAEAVPVFELAPYQVYRITAGDNAT